MCLQSSWKLRQINLCAISVMLNLLGNLLRIVLLLFQVEESRKQLTVADQEKKQLKTTASQTAGNVFT